jgi:hypothetical protein
MQTNWQQPPVPNEPGFYWVCVPGTQVEGQPPTEYSLTRVELIEVTKYGEAYIPGSNEGGKVGWYADSPWIRIDKPEPQQLPPYIYPQKETSLGYYAVACTVAP